MIMSDMSICIDNDVVLDPMKYIVVPYYFALLFHSLFMLIFILLSLFSFFNLHVIITPFVFCASVLVLFRYSNFSYCVFFGTLFIYKPLLTGTSHCLFFVCIIVIVVVSQWPIFSSTFESWLILVFFNFFGWLFSAYIVVVIGFCLGSFGLRLSQYLESWSSLVGYALL